MLTVPLKFNLKKDERKVDQQVSKCAKEVLKVKV